jgi:hypothetical protein
MLLFQNLWFHVCLTPQLTLPIRYLQKMLDIFASHPFYTTHTHLPITNAPVSSAIHNNLKCWPYFHDAIGAIDGSHVPFSASHHLYYCNWKDFVSQNCLFVCNFDLKFMFALMEWEGSATDSWLWGEACNNDLDIPLGKYLLADLGFPSCWQLLVPYHDVHYYLAERGCASIR